MKTLVVVTALAASLAGTLVGCMSAPESTGAVQTTDTAELDRRAAAWRGCLVKSFATQRATTRDRAFAAELAFQACATEERAAVEYTVAQSGPMETSQLNQLIADGKAKMKAELIAGRPIAQ
jgi:hypothetical protein